MATAQLEKVKEFLTCTVCYDTYSDPCTLMCQHSFCRNCITKYTKSKPEALRTKTIPCPSCRQVTKVPDPTKPVQQWAAQIKPSIIILGLIDTLQFDPSTKGSGRQCNACEKLGETTPATSWCPECEMALCDRCTKLHQINPASQDHEVCDLSADVKIRKKRKVMCREHKKSQIEFHCRDCKKSACQTCCILLHRPCKSVVTIESMRSDMTLALHEKRDIMTKRLERKSANLSKNKTSMNKASEKKITVKSQIQSAIKRVIDKIKQKEVELIDKLDQDSEIQMSQLQADVKSEEIEVQMYRQHCEFIDQALNSESVMDMYDVYQACESAVLDPVSDRDTVSENRQQIVDISFTQDASKVQRVLDDLQLGRIDVIYQDVRPSVTTSAQPNYDKINVRTREDQQTPKLWDITTLVVNNEEVIITTDMENNCVKSFYVRSGKWRYSRLPLDNSPSGLSRLKENQMVVPVPLSYKIITVKVNPDLTLISTLKTGSCCFSVGVISASSMAVGCVDSVNILSMTGQVMKSVSTNKYVKPFKYPFSICVNHKGNILVSDCQNKTATCLTPEGDVLWQYSPTGNRKLQYPAGITTDREGNVLLADREADKVIQLTERGEFVKEILTAGDGISNPRGLTCHKPGRVLVCEETSVREFDVT